MLDKSNILVYVRKSYSSKNLPNKLIISDVSTQKNIGEINCITVIRCVKINKEK